jgi:hypothetical protein
VTAQAVAGQMPQGGRFDAQTRSGAGGMCI